MKAEGKTFHREGAKGAKETRKEFLRGFVPSCVASGGAHWSDEYIGIPYSPQMDCAGLVERVRREVFGHDLVLPSDRRPGPFGRSAQIAAQRARFVVETMQPADGDGVLLRARGRLQHIGLACLIRGELWVLHTVDGQGSTRLRLRELARAGYRVEGYYSWID